VSSEDNVHIYFLVTVQYTYYWVILPPDEKQFLMSQRYDVSYCTAIKLDFSNPFVRELSMNKITQWGHLGVVKHYSNTPSYSC